ncbi:MAG: FUSC family protein [Alicyclobacillaceae bacterium]|nr:FUSC family protein [Alicyclobacillaceae bacterium]
MRRYVTTFAGVRRIGEWLLRTRRIWKTALACALAWECAQWTGTHRPYFAPLAAILSLQVTVEESLWRGLQRVVGIVFGIVLADVVARFAGVRAWSIGLMVLVGTALASWMKLGQQAIPQVGISAIMVLTLGTHQPGYAWDRVVETVIGVAVAVVLNMLVLPPDYTVPAQTSLRASAGLLAGRFAAISAWLNEGADPAAGRRLQEETRAYLEQLHAAAAKLDQAVHALRYSPLVQHRRQRLERLQREAVHLRQGYQHATGMMRTLLEWQDAGGLQGDRASAWAGRFAAAAALIERWADDAFGTPHGDKPGPSRTMAAEAARVAFAWPPEWKSNLFEFALLNDGRQLLDDFAAPSPGAAGGMVRGGTPERGDRMDGS